MKIFLKVILAYIAAVLATLVLASIASTQIILGELSALGMPVPFWMRINVTLQDIIGIAPFLGIIVSVGFFIAFIVAFFLIKKINLQSQLWYSVAGACAIIAAIYTVNSMLDGIPLIASTRGFGLLAFALVGAVGGWVFSKITSSCSQEK